MNVLFEAVEREEDPMYDCALITEKGTEYWKNPCSNNANNSHSVTKFFIATCIGILRDRGLISLNDKVTSFFADSQKPDDMDPKWNDVTVEMALRHRMGIDELPYGVDEDDDIEKIGNDFLKYVFSLKIMTEPGTVRRYSDEAYYLLGRIIHAVTGQTADVFLKENVLDKLGFRQWTMVKCPQGFPICGGGFFTRSDDNAKLGYAYACGGIYEGKRIISEEWIKMAMENDYACSRFRRTSIWLKTGARGQIVAFSEEKKVAVAWHGCAMDSGKRNDRLLEAFATYLGEDYSD